MSLKEKVKITAANTAIKFFLSKINGKVQDAIRDNHLDPMTSVTHGETELGNWEGNSVTASYDLSNLTGLSSIIINNIHFSANDEDEDEDKDSGATASFDFSFGDDLKVDANGKLLVKTFLGNLDPSVSGTLTNSQTTLTGTANVVLGKVRDLELKSAKVETLNLQMGSNKIELHGDLGLLNSFLGKAEDAIESNFREELENIVSSTMKDALNEALAAMMPLKLRG